MAIKEDNISTYDLTFNWLSMYIVPEDGPLRQENLSIVKPSPPLSKVTEHILAQLSTLGKVERMTAVDVYPPMYQIKQTDGSHWTICLPTLVDEPTKPFKRVFQFVLPKLDP